jgi:hypothetical protein
VTSVSLSKDELVVDSDDKNIEVLTEFFDPEGDVLTFNYLVSAGRIVGRGRTVTWDLTGVSPGIYTITVGVNDGMGVCGDIKTRRVEILACETCRLREME